MPHPRRLDCEALNVFLTYGYVPGDGCLLEGYRKLPKAHVLAFDLATGGVRIERYWTLPHRSPPPSGAVVDREPLVERVKGLMHDAVRLRLTASDVPVGVLLSGGLDSSLVTAFASRVSTTKVKTYSVTFPGHDALDEAGHARLVARHLGTEHHELPLQTAAWDVLPLLARHYDEPIADSSIVPTYLLSRMVREQVKVALDGDGADELFGGYRHYEWAGWHASIRRWTPRWARGLASDAAAHLLPVGTPRRNHVIGLAGPLPWGIAHINVYFDSTARARLLASQVRREILAIAAPESTRAALTVNGDSPLRSAAWTDFETYLPDDLLVKVDRASMATALELRAPWLDHRVIEFALNDLPESLRASGGQRKILLRLLARELLPPAFDVTRKQGFTPPLAAWLRNQWKPLLTDVLSQAPPSVFDPTAVGSLLEGESRGRVNSQRLFAILMFELWRREYRVEVP